MGNKREKALHGMLVRFRSNGANVISLLQDIQSEYGYIPEDLVDWFSEKLDIPASRFFGVITFYPKFRTSPLGKNTLTVCCGAACHIKGSDAILESARTGLALDDEKDTSADGQVTIQKATCIGACNIAPVAILNDDVHGNMDPVKINVLIDQVRDTGGKTE